MSPKQKGSPLPGKPLSLSGSYSKRALWGGGGGRMGGIVVVEWVGLWWWNEWKFSGIMMGINGILVSHDCGES